MIGLPSTVADVALFPPDEATTSVLPLADGRGVFIGIRITSSPFSIVACIVVSLSLRLG